VQYGGTGLPKQLNSSECCEASIFLLLFFLPLSRSSCVAKTANFFELKKKLWSGVVQHSKSGWLMTGWGHNRRLPRCNIYIRFTSLNGHNDGKRKLVAGNH
jgi:hypothetical protein